LLHHLGKPREDGAPATSPLGSTAIEAWARQLVRVTRIKGTRQCTIDVEGNDVEPFQLKTLHEPAGKGADGAFFTVLAEAKPREYERSAQRLDDAANVAAAVRDAGEVFTTLYGVAKWLETHTPQGLEQRSQKAWEQYLKRAVLPSGMLTGGLGKPFAEGAALADALAEAA
jgi:hypothetical protein